jgi:hypothetical protein
MATSGRTLALRSALVWIVMVVVLIVVPDTLESWMPIDIARVCGWVLASGLWVAILERDWRERFRPIPRFFLQVTLWLAAALLAIEISERARVGDWPIG